MGSHEQHTRRSSEGLTDLKAVSDYLTMMKSHNPSLYSLIRECATTGMVFSWTEALESALALKLVKRGEQKGCYKPSELLKEHFLNNPDLDDVAPPPRPDSGRTVRFVSDEPPKAGEHIEPEDRHSIRLHSWQPITGDRLVEFQKTYPGGVAIISRILKGSPDYLLYDPTCECARGSFTAIKATDGSVIKLSVPFAEGIRPVVEGESPQVHEPWRIFTIGDPESFTSDKVLQDSLTQEEPGITKAIDRIGFRISEEPQDEEDEILSIEAPSEAQREVAQNGDILTDEPSADEEIRIVVEVAPEEEEEEGFPIIIKIESDSPGTPMELESREPFFEARLPEAETIPFSTEAQRGAVLSGMLKQTPTLLILLGYNDESTAKVYIQSQKREATFTREALERNGWEVIPDEYIHLHIAADELNEFSDNLHRVRTTEFETPQLLDDDEEYEEEPPLRGIARLGDALKRASDEKDENVSAESPAQKESPEPVEEIVKKPRRSTERKPQEQKAIVPLKTAPVLVAETIRSVPHPVFTELVGVLDRFISPTLTPLEREELVVSMQRRFDGISEHDRRIASDRICAMYQAGNISHAEASGLIRPVVSAVSLEEEQLDAPDSYLDIWSNRTIKLQKTGWIRQTVRSIQLDREDLDGRSFVSIDDIAERMGFKDRALPYDFVFKLQTNAVGRLAGLMSIHMGGHPDEFVYAGIWLVKKEAGYPVSYPELTEALTMHEDSLGRWARKTSARSDSLRVLGVLPTGWYTKDDRLGRIEGLRAYLGAVGREPLMTELVQTLGYFEEFRAWSLTKE